MTTFRRPSEARPRRPTSRTRSFTSGSHSESGLFATSPGRSEQVHARPVREAPAALQSVLMAAKPRAPSRMVPFRKAGPRAHRYRWAETTAICWFRDEATEHVVRARRVAELVRAAGIP